MPTLLDFFEEYERQFQNLGLKDFHKLKDVYDRSTEKPDYGEMKFQLRTLIKLCESLKPVSMRLNSGRIHLITDETKFNPTLSGPNVIVRDSLQRDHSVWYRPAVYASMEEPRKLVPEFVVSPGARTSPYNLDDRMISELNSYGSLNASTVKAMSRELTSRLVPVSLLILAKKQFMSQDLIDMKAMQFYLKPKKMLIVSESGMENKIKMNAPVGATLVESVDMEGSQLLESMRKML